MLIMIQNKTTTNASKSFFQSIVFFLLLSLNRIKAFVPSPSIRPILVVVVVFFFSYRFVSFCKLH